MQYKTIDWELSLQRAGGNLATAQELLELFQTTLKTDWAKILAAYQDGDTETMAAIVHSTKGASCYVGVPALSHAVMELNQAIKESNEMHIPALFDQFKIEVEKFIAIEKFEKD